MAFPADPQDLSVEAYLGGAWRDITADVRDDPGIRIERGTAAEGSTSAPSPSTCSFTLDNSSGDYTPRNPGGEYFGALGRNTPVRVSVGQTDDDFGRTVASGWGTSSAGLAWSSTGTGSGSASVSGGKAIHTQNSTTEYRISYQTGAVYGTCAVAATVSLAVTNITGGSVEPCNLMLRGVSTVDYTMVRLVITTAETVTISIHSYVRGQLVAPVTVTGLTHSSGQALRVLAVVEGQTVHAKVWAATQPEPAGWQVSAVDPTMAATGWVGIRSGVAAGNTNVPVNFTYDNFEVRSPRWTGEVAEWPVSADTSGTDVTTAVTASGLLRRLSQGSAPLRSAMYRGHLSPERATPIAYWPMEDGSDATAFASAIGGGPMKRGSGSDVNPAASTTFAASEPLPTLDSGPLRGPVPAYTSTGTLVLYALVAVPTGGIAVDDRLLVLTTHGGSIATWVVQLEADGDMLVAGLDQDGVAVYSTGAVAFAMNGTMRLLRLSLVQVGSNIAIDLATADVGAVSVGGISTTATSQTLGRCTTVTIASRGQNLNGLVIGHVALKTTDDYSLWSTATQAWVGETAGDRIVRLCAEQDVPLTIVGDPGDTVPMGPQSAATLLDLLEECAAADGGVLAEPAGALGLLYRTRVSQYSQPARAILDQTVGQVLPALEPVDDDRYIANEVTVTRDGGSSATAAQTSGPLAVAEPPTGVGRYATAVTLNLATDEQLDEQAAWRLHLGTLDEARYPSVRASLAKTASLRSSVLAAAVGDRLGVTHDRPARYGQQPIDGLVIGYTEQLARFEHEFDWTLVPATGYAVGVIADTTGDVGEFVLRADTDGSTLTASVAAGGTSMSVATPTGPLWTTLADDFPLEVTVGGIAVTVTGISGASSPQAFTIQAAPYPLSSGAAVSVLAPVVAL